VPARRTRKLRAIICEIEPGLFQAVYIDPRAAVESSELPDYQVGSSASEVKRWFEQTARALGYESVTWVKASAADLVRPKPGHGSFAPPVTTSSAGPLSTMGPPVSFPIPF
jgi:hypothetical protein